MIQYLFVCIEYHIELIGGDASIFEHADRISHQREASGLLPGMIPDEIRSQSIEYP